jgi:hypothetical protein
MPPTLTEFKCKGNHIEIPTGESTSADQAGFIIKTTHLELFRAKDRSLIVMQEERDAGIGIVVPFLTYWHKWWRYMPIADTPTPQGSSTP